MKQVYIILIFFIVLKANSQTPEYAYLVKTKINGYLHANTGEVSISYDNKSAGYVEHRAQSNNVGKVYFSFVSLPNNFNEAKIKVYNEAIGAASFPDCFYERERIIKREDFIQRTSYFGRCSFSQTVYPLHIEGPTRLEPLCTRNSIELKGGYDWDYQIGNEGWKPIASSINSININIGDLYAAVNIDVNLFENGHANRSLHFRTGHRESNKYVAAITYRVIGCSPKFNNYYDIMKTSCSYKKDGKVSLSLDRNLGSNERLIATLYTSDKVLIGQETQETSLINLGVNAYGFTWPKLLDYGKYYFLYQSQNKGLAIPTAPSNDDGSSWDKLVKTPEFEVLQAKEIVFNAEKVKDKACVSENDGKIKISNVSGEPGRNFSYIIIKPDGTSEEIEFTGNSAIISGLSNGKHKIKVKDNKGCLAK